MDAHRGHEISLRHGVWVYADTGRAVSEDPHRACGHCGLPNTPEGYDGCLGRVPGALNACCGHGDPKASYVQMPAITHPAAPVEPSAPRGPLHSPAGVRWLNPEFAFVYVADGLICDADICVGIEDVEYEPVHNERTALYWVGAFHKGSCLLYEPLKADEYKAALDEVETFAGELEEAAGVHSGDENAAEFVARLRREEETKVVAA